MNSKVRATLRGQKARRQSTLLLTALDSAPRHVRRGTLFFIVSMHFQEENYYRLTLTTLQMDIGMCNVQ